MSEWNKQNEEEFSPTKEHLLFASVDVAEMSLGGQYQPSTMVSSGDGGGSPVLLLHPLSTMRRIVISITQSDRAQFSLESLASVTLGRQISWLDGLPLSPPESTYASSSSSSSTTTTTTMTTPPPSSTSFRPLEVVSSIRIPKERTLKCVVDWEPSSTHDAPMLRSMHDGSTVEMVVVMDLYVRRIAKPVHVNVKLRFRLSDQDGGATFGSGLKKRLSTLSNWTFNASDRGDPHQRRRKELGRRFLVTVQYGGESSGVDFGGGETPIKTPRRGVTSTTTPNSGSSQIGGNRVPSILSTQALALLEMKDILRNERMRQLRALQARLVAEGGTSTQEVATVDQVIELMPAPRRRKGGGGGEEEGEGEGEGEGGEEKDETALRSNEKEGQKVKPWEDEEEDAAPPLPPRRQQQGGRSRSNTGHRRPLSWTRSDFVRLKVKSVDDSAGGEDDRVSIGGYLLKRRAFIGGWNRRYFVVVYPHLLYFVSAEDHLSGSEARGIFDLSRCKVGSGNGMFDIVLHHEDLKKRWILQASSKEEMKKWVDAFRSKMS